MSVAIFRAALDAVDARRCVRESLERRPVRGGWHVIAIGKAAGAMAFGTVDALGEHIQGGRIIMPPDHLPHGFDPGAHGLVVLHGAHPVPDERSLAAGEEVARYVSALPAGAQILFLVSGGASALVEWLRPGVTLDDLAGLNRHALASGESIEQINARRRKLSRLKGGGLATLAAPRRSLALMISDVPGDDPRVIGSGLLHPPGRNPDAARRVPVRLVATLRTALNAAAQAARARGWKAIVARSRLQGPAAEAGQIAVERAARLPPGSVWIAGGETTVVLPEPHGRGGRNQHLALAAAIELEARGLSDVTVLAAGTDGIDGATTDAGALVDADTCMRGRDAGFEPDVSLASADSGSFLEATGDLLHTGPTLTNVGDLVIAAKPPTRGVA